MRIQAFIVITLILAFTVRSLPLERVSGVVFGIIHSDMSTEAADTGEEGLQELPEFRQADAQVLARWRLPNVHGKKASIACEGRHIGDRGADDVQTPPPDRLG